MGKVAFHALIVASLGLGGCASMSTMGTMFETPVSTNPAFGNTWPQEVHYELLGVATAEACANLDDLGFVVPGSTASAGPHPALVAEAKYKAIESVSGADNLMYMRVKAVTTDSEDVSKQCVTVTGRAYRVSAMISHPAGETTCSSCAVKEPAAPAPTTPRAP